jgi:hypothetical protein
VKDILGLEGLAGIFSGIYCKELKLVDLDPVNSKFNWALNL